MYGWTYVDTRCTCTSHRIDVTGFETGQYTLTDYLTGFLMYRGATNGCKSGQPALKWVGLRIWS